MIPSSSSFSRVIPIMPSKDASAQKANRERLKAEKEERRRLGRERANESRKKRRANPELHAVDRLLRKENFKIAQKSLQRCVP